MANKGGQYVIVDGERIPRDQYQGQKKLNKTQPEKAATSKQHTQNEDSVDDTTPTV